MASLITGALAPVFGLILLGYACGRFGMLGDAAFDALNRFVIVFAMPALTFRTVAHMNAADLTVVPMIVAVIGGALVSYALIFAIEHWSGRRKRESNIAGLCACFSNTGFVGLPVALLAFGADTLPPVAVTMVIYSVVVFTAAVVIGEITAGLGGGISAGLRAAAHAVMRNPLILLSMLGVAWAVAGLPLSGPLDKFCQTLASATAPCALTAVGLFIARPRESAAAGPIARVVFAKLALQPAITACLVFILPAMPSPWGKMAILMAAMPCGATSFVLAGKAGHWAMELSAWAVTLTTVLAALSLIPILWWLASV